MKVGDLVHYTKDSSCVGTILQLGETMNKVHWSFNNVIEWIPKHTLELVNESR